LSPQLTEQSGSSPVLQPAGQQLSPDSQLVTIGEMHATLQLAALPVITSWVQGLPSKHPAAQLVGGSQVSPGSSWLLPHVVEQSESVVGVHAAGQHPSPEAQPLTRGNPQTMSQLSALPVIWSVVQACPS
jgi:hypothetical protein